MPSEYILCIYISHRMCLTAVVSYPHLNQCVSNADLFFAPSPHPRHQTCYTHLMIFLFQMPFSCEMVILSPSISRSRERQLGVENPTSQFFSLLGSPFFSFFYLPGWRQKMETNIKKKIYIYIQVLQPWWSQTLKDRRPLRQESSAPRAGHDVLIVPDLSDEEEKGSEPTKESTTCFDLNWNDDTSWSVNLKR